MDYPKKSLAMIRYWSTKTPKERTRHASDIARKGWEGVPNEERLARITLMNKARLAKRKALKEAYDKMMSDDFSAPL